MKNINKTQYHQQKKLDYLLVIYPLNEHLIELVIKIIKPQCGKAVNIVNNS